MANAVMRWPAMSRSRRWRSVGCSRSPPISPIRTCISWAVASSRQLISCRDRYLSVVRTNTHLRAEQVEVAEFSLVPDLDMAGARGAAVAARSAFPGDSAHHEPELPPPRHRRHSPRTPPNELPPEPPKARAPLRAVERGAPCTATAGWRRSSPARARCLGQCLAPSVAAPSATAHALYSRSSPCFHAQSTC